MSNKLHFFIKYPEKLILLQLFYVSETNFSQDKACMNIATSNYFCYSTRGKFIKENRNEFMNGNEMKLMK